jgi:hypothetical protein
MISSTGSLTKGRVVVCFLSVGKVLFSMRTIYCPEYTIDKKEKGYN